MSGDLAMALAMDRSGLDDAESVYGDGAERPHA
jgi:hypothetical protein